MNGTNVNEIAQWLKTAVVVNGVENSELTIDACVHSDLMVRPLRVVLVLELSSKDFRTGVIIIVDCLEDAKKFRRWKEGMEYEKLAG